MEFIKLPSSEPLNTHTSTTTTIDKTIAKAAAAVATIFHVFAFLSLSSSSARVVAFCASSVYTIAIIPNILLQKMILIIAHTSIVVFVVPLGVPKAEEQLAPQLAQNMASSAISFLQLPQNFIY